MIRLFRRHFNRELLARWTGLTVAAALQFWWWPEAVRLMVPVEWFGLAGSWPVSGPWLQAGIPLCWFAVSLLLPLVRPVTAGFVFPLLLTVPGIAGALEARQILEGMVTAGGTVAGSFPLPFWVAAVLAAALLVAGMAAAEPVRRGRRAFSLLLTRFSVRVLQLWTLAPFLWMAAAAFWKVDTGSGLWESLWQGRGHFSFSHFALLGSGPFPGWVLNSLLWAAGVTALCMVPAVAGGYLLSRLRFWGRRQILAGSGSLQLLPGVLLLPVLSWGAFRIGFPAQWQAAVLIYPVFVFPFMIWMLKGMFDSLPRAVEESAVLDGVSRFGRVWHVLLPQMRTGLLVVFSYGFMAVWGEYAAARYCFGGDPSRWTVPLGLHELLRRGELGQFAAGSLLGSLPVVIIFVYLHKQLLQVLSGNSAQSRLQRLRIKIRRRMERYSRE